MTKINQKVIQIIGESLTGEINKMRNRSNPSSIWSKYNKRYCPTCGVLLRRGKTKTCKKHIEYKPIGEIAKKKISVFQTGRIKSELERKNISLSKRGNKSHFWKGGITEENKNKRLTGDYKRWRIEVFKRDDYKCVICGYKARGQKPADIQADHIKPMSIFPEYMLDLSNGRTLCVPCHKKTETYGNRRR